MKFAKKYETMTVDAGFNSTIKISDIWRYLQETACYHMKSEGPSYSELFGKGLSFILSRMNMEIYRPLYEFEKITVETWAIDGRGAAFSRCYRILDEKGDVVLAASSVWALVDVNSKKLIKSEDVGISYGSDEPLELSLPSRLRINKEFQFNKVGEKTVMFSDIDCNGHMNNCNYPGMLCDYIPDIPENTVSAISINFISEAPFKSVISIERAEEGLEDAKEYYFKTYIDGKTNVEAMIKVKKI